MPSIANIHWFADLRLADRATVGGKGASLGELMRANIAVPPGFVIATPAFERVLAELDQDHSIRARVEALRPDALEEISRVAEDIRARFESAPLSQNLSTDIVSAHTELCGANVSSPVAVRSSATAEDSEDASFAGLQDTFLGVRGAAAALKYVRSCWASLYSVASISYRRKHGIAETGVAIAVVVQKMVDARSAGVMFTRSPTTGDRSVITIEATWGLGSALVSGEVTPDRFVIGKISGEISVREISHKFLQHVPAESGGTQELETPEELRRAPSISDGELKALAEIGRQVERHYGRPQDIEWAIERSGKILVLQSRPETVWSVKEKPPVATPAENPLLHVMNIFGGRR